MTAGSGYRVAGRGGQTLIEFSVVVLLTVIMLLFIVELARMVLVYTTVANSARAAVRYAIVHGSSRATGTGMTNASGPSSNPTQVVTVVKNFAGAGLLSLNLLVISVTYPGGSNAPGQSVQVSVVYPYNPFTTYFSSSLRLGSVAQGIIVY